MKVSWLVFIIAGFLTMSTQALEDKKQGEVKESKTEATEKKEAGKPASEESTKLNKDSTPEEVVKMIFKKAAEPNVSSKKSAQDKVNEMVDFKFLAESVLGKEKENRNKKQKLWFDQTLMEIITRTVYPEAPNFLKNVQIRYKKSKIEGETAKVFSILRRKGEITDVDYTLRKTSEGWRVIDVTIDGESWVENIREQVFDTLAAKKWGGLERKMNRKLASLKSNSTKATRSE